QRLMTLHAPRARIRGLTTFAAPAAITSSTCKATGSTGLLSSASTKGRSKHTKQKPGSACACTCASLHALTLALQQARSQRSSIRFRLPLVIALTSRNALPSSSSVQRASKLGEPHDRLQIRGTHAAGGGYLHPASAPDARDVFSASGRRRNMDARGIGADNVAKR